MPADAVASPAPSLVLVSHNEGANLRTTVANLVATSPPGTEVIVVDDQSTDGSADFLAAGRPDVRLLRPPGRLGASAARNHGGAAASRDVVVFSDAHVEAAPGWFEGLGAELEQPGVGIVGPAISSLHNREVKGYGRTWLDATLAWRWLPSRGDQAYAVPMLSGCFLAVKRAALLATGGFDEGMLIWGNEGAELCLRAWSLGYECRVVPSVDVAHLFKPTFTYEYSWELALHNSLRLGTTHFNRERLARLIDRLSTMPGFAAAMARVLEGDAAARRAHMLAVRQRDDDWFFDRFGIDVLD